MRRAGLPSWQTLGLQALQELQSAGKCFPAASIRSTDSDKHGMPSLSSAFSASINSTSSAQRPVSALAVRRS